MGIQFLKLYGITLVVFFLVDITWLAFVAPKLYQSQIGHLMSSRVNVAAAALFYLLFITGMVYFAIQPSVIANSPLQALFVGAFFGLITYATYDLTNLATLRDWPVLITVIDMTWGTTLSAIVSIIVFYLSRLLNI